MLPVMTAVLGPADFGLFALVAAITAVGSVFAGIGASYVLAAHFHSEELAERRRMVSTSMALSLGVGAIYGATLFGLWAGFGENWRAISAISWQAVVLAIFAMILSAPWIIASDILTLKGAASRFTAVSIMQSMIWAVAVAVSLHVFDLGLMSLFVGACAGAAAAFAGSMIVLREYLEPCIDARWVKELWKVAPRSTVANALSTLRTLIERTLLSAHVGVAQLGIYTHAQQYRNMVGMGAKAVSRGVWPVTLSDARDECSAFEITGRAWNVVHFGITAAGIAFATIGRDAIALLTHDKFTEAYVLVAAWMAYLLIQNSGRPHTGVLYALGLGRKYAGIVAVSSIAAIGLLFLLVPILGIEGAILAAFVEMILLRVGVQVYARRVRRIPFQDGWVLGGSVLIFGLLTMVILLEPGFTGRLGIFLGGLIILGFAGWNIVRDAWFRSRHVLASTARP